MAIFDEIKKELAEAYKKHPKESFPWLLIEKSFSLEELWRCVGLLVCEAGEVLQETNKFVFDHPYKNGDKASIEKVRKELIQTITVSLRIIKAIDRYYEKDNN